MTHMSLTAYWWSPRRDRRALLSEIRHNNVAWVRMRKDGGTWFRNFGDELSARVITEATGKEPAWAPMSQADVIGIGSVVELYIERAGTGLIWGSGLRSGEASSRIPEDRVLAVRGELTRTALGLPPSTPLGDAGLIARSIYSTRRRRGTVVLPHFSAFRHREGLAAMKALRADGSRVIAPSAPVDDVCTQIAGADHLVTSSLHGLVVADALGIPATLVDFVETREPTHKYHDYCSVYGISAQFEPVASLFAPAQRAEIREAASIRAGIVGPQVDALVEGLLGAAKRFR